MQNTQKYAEYAKIKHNIMMQKNMQETCKTYAKNMHVNNMQYYAQYATNMQNYAKNMQKMCNIYVKYEVYANHANV